MFCEDRPDSINFCLHILILDPLLVRVFIELILSLKRVLFFCFFNTMLAFILLESSPQIFSQQDKRGAGVASISLITSLAQSVVSRLFKLWIIRIVTIYCPAKHNGDFLPEFSDFMSMVLTSRIELFYLVISTFMSATLLIQKLWDFCPGLSWSCAACSLKQILDDNARIRFLDVMYTFFPWSSPQIILENSCYLSAKKNQ